MTNPDQLEDDLHFVRNAVERQQMGVMPLSIAILWSGFVLLGFTMLDLRPAVGGVILFVGAPLCYLMSLRLGTSSARAAGIRDSISGTLHLLHWGTLLLSSGVLLLVAMRNDLPGEVVGQIFLVLSGVVYILGGVHFRIRALVGVGLAMMGLAALLTYLERWGWTGAGVIIAAGMIASARRGEPDDRG